MATNEGQTITEDESDEMMPISEEGGAASEATGAENTHRTHEERWEEVFQLLLGFKRIHGHCNVPFRYEKDPHLGRWVSLQRSVYKAESHNNSIDRVARLNEIGFDWAPKDPRSVSWETRYRELAAYVQKYGSAKVPLGWKENVQLANWVSAQRREYKLLLEGNPSRLTAARVEALNRVKFVWKVLARAPKRKRGEIDGGSDASESDMDRKPAAVGGAFTGSDSDSAPVQPASLVSFARQDSMASLSAIEGNAALPSDHSVYSLQGSLRGQSMPTSRFLPVAQLPVLSQLLHPSQLGSPYATASLPAIQLRSLLSGTLVAPSNEIAALLPYLSGQGHFAANSTSTVMYNSSQVFSPGVTHDTRIHNFVHMREPGSNLSQYPLAIQLQYAVPTMSVAASATPRAAPQPPGCSLVPWNLVSRALAASSQQQTAMGSAALRDSGTGRELTDRGQRPRSPPHPDPPS